MADAKISALPAASALTGPELLAGVQSSANVKVTADQVKTFANGTVTSGFFMANFSGAAAAPQGVQLVAGTGITFSATTTSLTITSSIVQKTVVALGGLTTTTFASISGAYTNLRVTVVGRGDPNALTADPFIRVNGLSTGIYSYQRQFAETTNNTADSSLGQTSLSPVDIAGATATANVVGIMEITIEDYAGSTFRKSGLFRGRQPNSTTTAASYIMHGTIEIAVTAAVTSLEVGLSSGAFVTGSIAIMELW